MISGLFYALLWKFYNQFRKCCKRKRRLCDDLCHVQEWKWIKNLDQDLYEDVILYHFHFNDNYMGFKLFCLFFKWVGSFFIIDLSAFRNCRCIREKVKTIWSTQIVLIAPTILSTIMKTNSAPSRQYARVARIFPKVHSKDANSNIKV